MSGNPWDEEEESFDLGAKLEAFPNLRQIWAGQDDLDGFCEEAEAIARNYRLTCAAIEPEPVENALVVRFSGLIDEGFNALCRDDPTPHDVPAAFELARIRDSLRAIAAFPQLFNKRICAVGGGFSSGKSAFINSFLEDNSIRLAEGVRPVTAIPSYVIAKGKEPTAIKGVNFRSGVFNLDAGIYQNLSHSLLRSLKYDLKALIKYITVLAPLYENLFANICIMDTPGYNPPQSGSEKADRATAREYISKGDFLVWLVGLDANGAISGSDLDFISQMDFGKPGGKPFYLVLSKADLVPESNIAAVLEGIAATLDAAGIEWQGMCAYSAKKNRMFNHKKEDLFTFLARFNRPSDIYAEYSQRTRSIFAARIRHINQDCDRANAIRRKIKNLQLAALESGMIGIGEANSEIDEGLGELLGEFGRKSGREARIERVTSLRDAFIVCLDQFCEELGINRQKKRFCTACGARMPPDAAQCPACGKGWI